MLMKFRTFHHRNKRKVTVHIIISLSRPYQSLQVCGLNLEVDPGGPVVIILASGSVVRGFDPGSMDFQSVNILI